MVFENFFSSSEAGLREGSIDTRSRNCFILMTSNLCDIRPLIDDEGGVSVFEPGDVLDPGEPGNNTVGLQIKSSKQHRGNDEERTNTEGEVNVGRGAGEEVAKTGGNLNSQENDAKSNEVLNHVWVDVGHPVDDAESDEEFGNYNGSLNK